ncbi:MAG: fibronectin type III domain-containing protein, partial [Halanaerobiales bacterium]
ILEDGETCILSKDNYEVTFGPDPNNPDMCILDQDPSDGIGRFPHNHKISADEGGYRSGLVDDMWDLYRYDIPYIADDPVPQTVNSGSTVTFSVTVRSNSPINYKWLFNGHSTQHGIENMIVVDNQEDDEHKNYKIYKITLEMDSAQVEYSGNYKLEVTNDIDTVISKEATLTIFDSPEVSNLECIVEYHTAYLKWNNPANRGEDWDNLIVVRKEGSKPDTPEDGEKIYDGKGSSLVDKNLSEGDYYYAIYTYKKHDTNYVYSYPANIRATIPQLYNKHYTVIDGVQEQSLIIGQNTRGDLYTLWNEDNLTIGKGPDGNKTDIYLYSDIFGSEQEQIPAGSQIVSSRLVFKVKDYDGKDDEEPSDEIKNTRSINVYRIIDPDKLGLPFFAEKSGIRTGLDFYYRDHRPGINRAWVETDDDQIDNGESAHYSSILNMTKNIEPVEVIAFSPEVFKEDRINTIQFDITEAVQAWSDGDEEQGMFITIGQGWENNEQMMLYGLNTYKSEQPYLEIIYADSNEVLDPPAAVENLNMIPGTDSITLNWKSPDDTEVSGVKILRREGIIPSTNQDEKIVVSLTGESYLDIGESYTDSGLTTGNTYYYAVYTYNEQHDYSEKVWIKGTPGSPTIKPILNAASSGQGIVSLSWEQIDGALYYNIYRQDEGLSYDILGSVKQAQSPTFADYVMPGDYIYRVAAVNDIGEGPLSEEQSVTINENAEYKPETPDNFSGLPISGSEIKLSWDDCSDEIGYVIEKKRIDQEWVDGVVVAVLTFDMVSYIDDDLLPDTEYTYRIKAVNSSSESDYSEDINIKTSNLPLAVKNITWEVISGSQIKVEWEDTPNEDGYKVELFELTEDVEMIDGEVLDTQNLSANIVYCFFVTLEPGKEYRIVVTTIKGENTAEAYSDIIRTSSDSKGGLF